MEEHSTQTSATFEPLILLTKDLKEAAKTMGRQEARFLVDAYYTIQRQRIRANNQLLALQKFNEPANLLPWFVENFTKLESNIKTVLDRYSDGQLIGRWSKSITGIGPVISAGLMAYIDIGPTENKCPKCGSLEFSEKIVPGRFTECVCAACDKKFTLRPQGRPTVSSIWKLAGLDPTVRWNKGELRPWNANLKLLCWKIGESFVKVSNLSSDIYGKVYLHRKQIETDKNDNHLFADQAKLSLDTRNFSRDTDARKAYLEGKLPKGRIHLRAQRYAVKLFLSHWHAVQYEIIFGTPPPKPYVLEHLGHADWIKPPNWPMR